MNSQNDKPHLVIPIGITGSGKSHFAEHFAATFKAPLVSLQKLTSKLFGAASSPRQLAAAGKIAEYLLDELLKTGRTVVYDGQMSKRSDRSKIKKKARDFGYEPVLVWVQSDQLTAKKRTSKSNFDEDLNKFEEPLSSDKVVVISGKHTFSSQLKIILKFLASRPLVNQQPNNSRRPLIPRR